MTVMVLPLRSAGFLDARIRAHDELHESLAAEQATIFTGTPFCRTTIGASATMPPSGYVAGADLLGDIDAAAADRVAHVETGVLEIALALGEPDRSESRQQRRRREQISDLLIRPRRRRDAQTPRPSAMPARPAARGGAIMLCHGRTFLAPSCAGAAAKSAAGAPALSAIPVFATILVISGRRYARNRPKQPASAVDSAHVRCPPRIPQRDDALCRPRRPRRAHGGAAA